MHYMGNDSHVETIKCGSVLGPLLCIIYVAVEVLGVSTRVGHRTCIRASLHVRHTGSLRGRYAHI